MESKDTDMDKQGNIFANNLRRVVGASYILADSTYGARSYILAEGYKKEMEHYSETSDEYKKLDVLRKGELKEIAGMGLWSAGGVVMALFGNRSTANEMKALSSKLAAFLQDEGVNLEGKALELALKEKNKGVLQKVMDFAYKYPSEIMHTCFAIGATGLIQNGYGKYKQDKSNIGTLGMGISVLVGALIGVFVPEKTPDQLAQMPPANNGLDKAGRFLQQHANKATSLAYLSNNAFSAKGILEDKKTFKDNWQGKADQSKAFRNVHKIRAGALGTYIFGAGVLAATSKSSGKKGDGVNYAKDKILQEAVEMLAHLPESEQKTHIDNAAKYLSTQRELGFAQIPKEEIAVIIADSLHQQQQDKNLADNWVEKSSNVPSGPNRTV